jgi:hypothetical protein
MYAEPAYVVYDSFWALWYNNAKYVTPEYADKLKKTPTSTFSGEVAQ